MSNNVFANGREVSCKKADGKSICCFPDVCFTPPDKVPPTPPGVPIPYPNTGMAKDATGGSKKVKISGQEVMLKNQSYFKTSVGNEAGCATKKGIMTSKTKGKVYFAAWSMDIKVEGQNVVRHLDITTHNHGSNPNTVPWPYADSQALAPGGACHADSEKEKEACKEYKPQGDKDACPSEISGVAAKDLTQKKIHKEHYEKLEQEAKQNGCLSARKCRLAPYDAEKDGVNGCCPGQTGDHVIDDANFKRPGGYLKNYSHGKAPCICASGPNNTWASHGKSHSIKGHFAKCYKAKHGVSEIPYSVQKKLSATAVRIVFKSAGCSQACIEAQLDAYFKDPKKPIVDDSTSLHGKASGQTESGYAKDLLKQMAKG
jgi:hypothetical protein